MLPDIKNPPASVIDENGNPVTASNVLYASTDQPAPPKGSASLPLRVDGQQYVWRFQYPKQGNLPEVFSYVDMVVPVGVTVTLDITADDVVHSWWIPKLGGKMDAVPGYTNKTWFQIPESAIPEGEDQVVYHGQCAEFCGIEHAMMLTQVRAVSNSEYESWVTRQLGVNTDIGRMTFEGACAPCHGMQGQGIIGPPLKGNATVANPKQLATLLANGKGKMPPVGKGWTPKELASLVAYLRKEFASGG